MAKKIILTALCLALLFTACASPQEPKKEESRETLRVLWLQGTDRYPAVQALLDDDRSAWLEQQIGMNLEAVKVESDWNPDDVAEIESFDLFLFDEPIWIIPLAERKRIRFQTMQDGEDAVYGRYLGVQYGYVFPNTQCRQSPTLLVLPDALEAAGIRQIPYTPESVKTALQTLSESCHVPMAVCGEPVESSYCALLGLFGIAPTGGNEFCVVEDTVCYDKLSEGMLSYLNYLRELYTLGLLPEDMLVLSEYGMINMLYNNISVMAVFSDDVYLAEAVRLFRENGKRIAVAELPLAPERYEIHVDKRLIGCVAAGGEHAQQAIRLQQLLAASTEAPDSAVDLSGVEVYPLFADGEESPLPEVYDVLEEYGMHLPYWYQKQDTDNSCLFPFFDQAVTGKTDVTQTQFETICDEWLNRGDAISTENPTNNRTILVIYDKYYHTHGSGKTE